MSSYLLNDRFVAAALAASDGCIKIIGLDGSLQYMRQGGQRVMEVEDFATIRGCPWPDFWRDQGNIDAAAALNKARASRSARFTGFADTANGNTGCWDVKVSPISGEDGMVERILSISRDITALKEVEDQQILLRHEMGHRIKDLFALVHAVATQTLKDGDDMAVAKPAFLARLGMLSRAHDILVRSAHEITNLHAIAAAVAEEMRAQRIRVLGPAVLLSAKSGRAWPWPFTSWRPTP